MELLGNDIVDIVENPLDLSKRHLERFLSEEECEFLASAEGNKYSPWHFWAVKEAAFKAWRRLEPSLPFLPTRIIFRPDQGQVRYPEFRALSPVAAMTSQESGYLYAECYSLNLDPVRVIRKIINCPTEESATRIRVAIGRAIASALGVSGDEVIISRSGEVGVGLPPTVTVGGARCHRPLSLTHDGHFAAGAFLA